MLTVIIVIITILLMLLIINYSQHYIYIAATALSIMLKPCKLIKLDNIISAVLVFVYVLSSLATM